MDLAPVSKHRSDRNSPHKAATGGRDRHQVTRQLGPIRGGTTRLSAMPSDASTTTIPDSEDERTEQTSRRRITASNGSASTLSSLRSTPAPLSTVLPQQDTVIIQPSPSNTAHPDYTAQEDSFALPTAIYMKDWFNNLDEHMDEAFKKLDGLEESITSEPSSQEGPKKELTENLRGALQDVVEFTWSRPKFWIPVNEDDILWHWHKTDDRRCQLEEYIRSMGLPVPAPHHEIIQHQIEYGVERWENPPTLEELERLWKKNDEAEWNKAQASGLLASRKRARVVVDGEEC